MKKISTRGLYFIFGFIYLVQAQKITNFTSPKRVYDFAFNGENVWVATSGGLFCYNIETGEGYLRPAESSFPDPRIRALTFDNTGNLWAASEDGYLLRKDSKGGEYVNNSYVSAGWRILDMIAVDKYLIIASDKGVSLFDTQKKSVVKNATRIGTFVSSQIYTIAIERGFLYIGGESGVAVLTLPIENIENANFYDYSIWQTIDTAIGPVYGFLSINDTLRPFTTPAARFRNAILTGDSNRVIASGAKDDTLRFGSVVTTIAVQNVNRCWIGTEEDFFWLWDGAEIRQIRIDGPTFASANRVLVDNRGILWVLPYGWGVADYTALPVPWWLGINSFDGNKWRKFGPAEYPGMGHMATSTKAEAILQTRDGRIWFGFEGGQIKCHNPLDGSWIHYCIFGQGEGNGAFVKVKGPCPESDWGKCDAIAQDSAGYMWISSWNNYKGSLICYLPSADESNDLAGRYRRFPPMGEFNVPDPADINTITVDKTQNIIYGTENGELYIARYDKNPLTDSIYIIKKVSNLRKIFKAVTLSDNTTLIVSADGIHRYKPSDNSLTRIKNFDNQNITTLDCENDYVLWYGIPNEGVVRYEMTNDEKKVFNREQGLISTQINDIHVDKKNGYVWIATDKGLSRLSLGYTSAAPMAKKITAFPNPFSRRKHEVIYFRDIPIDAKLHIHSLNGNLVAIPKLVTKGEGGAYYEWEPPLSLPPGTYFYVVVTPSMRKSGKMILSP